MVAAKDVVKDLGRLQARGKTLRHKEVVDTPAHVLLSGMETIAPPTVAVGRVGIEVAERVDESAVEQRGHLCPFLVREARVHAVRFGILQVNLLMGDVHVATHDDRLLLVELYEIVAEGVLPSHPIIEALQTILAVRRIDAHQKVVRHLERDDASLVVVLLDAHAIGHIDRLMSGIYSGARVAFLLRVVPEGLIARETQVELSLLHLRLLKAHEVRVELGKHFAKVLSDNGTKPVDVPTDVFHSVECIILHKVTKKLRTMNYEL